MSRLLTTLLSGAVSFVTMVIILSPTAIAQTTDGVTPANEGVCDVLTDATPGLYDLCVAFCEAQDIGDVETAITEGDLAAFEAARPSGAILEAYNRSKNEADPDMPCVLAAESCPCWSAEELRPIYGADLAAGSFSEPFCEASPTYNSFRERWVGRSLNYNDRLARGEIRESEGGRATCLYSRVDTGDGTNIYRYIDSATSGLEVEIFQACRDQVVSVCETYGL